MPFTFSHPAIVLPLKFVDNKRFSVIALVIGSITPDFEYFINFEQRSIYSHTWLGIFWFDLPLSIVLFYVFTKTVKNELIDNLPNFLYQRFARFKNVAKIEYTLQTCLIIFTSLLIGITSHLFWDKLTHRSVRLVEEPMDFYPFIWDANSFIGALVIAFIVFRMPKKSIISKNDSFFYWFVLLLTTLIVIFIRSTYTTEVRAVGATTISGFLIGLFFTSIINKIRFARNPQAEKVSDYSLSTVKR